MKKKLCLMFVGAAALRSGFRRGENTSPVWLRSVGCRGHENRLLDCPVSYTIGNTNCGHGSDVGVRCPATSNCTTGEVRLREGTDNQGIVEICYFNIWGRVCTDLWGIADAEVVCRQLGYSTTSK